jgi:hypothetical protein
MADSFQRFAGRTTETESAYHPSTVGDGEGSRLLEKFGKASPTGKERVRGRPLDRSTRKT